MDECPACNSSDGTKLKLVTGYTEKMWKSKNDIEYNIEVYFCQDCGNIYGVRR